MVLYHHGSVFRIWINASHPGNPPGGKNLPVPPYQPPCPHLESLSPNWVCPPNFKNFTPIFSQFLLLFSSKLHQKPLFYAITPKFALICCRGAFLASTDNFSKSPLIWLRPWCESPIWLHPDRDQKQIPHHQNFVKKTWPHLQVSH